jgi:DNA-binding NarL/FixJ family response regulator
MIRVVIADDHAIVRAGIRALLASEGDITVAAEASDGRAAVAAVERARPDVLLVDLSMPGWNGVEAIRRAREVSPSTRVLVLSMHAAPDYVRPALRAGAHGYLVKGAGLDDLLRALRAVAAGERFFGPEAERVIQLDATDLAGDRGHDDLERLTPREREVLQLVAEGHTNREIGVALGVSPKTVDAHRSRVMQKLDLHDAQALTRFALRRGLVAGD